MRADLPLYYIVAFGEVRRIMKNQAMRAAAKTLSSVLVKAKPALLVLALVLLLPAASRADSVVLNSGTVSVQVPPGQTFISISNPGTFSLGYFNSEYFGPLVTSFSFQSITQGFGLITFQGQSVQFFTGSVSFNNSFLTGQVTGFQTLQDALNNNPLFTVTFTGEGFLESSLSSRSFTVATPEPATLLLLGLGLAASIGVRRKRKSVTLVSTEDLQDQ